MHSLDGAPTTLSLDPDLGPSPSRVRLDPHFHGCPPAAFGGRVPIRQIGWVQEAVPDEFRRAHASHRAHRVQPDRGRRAGRIPHHPGQRRRSC
jgi:hypothetical protein